MLSDPLGRALVANVATPDEFTVLFPSSVAPLKKFTLPSGDPVGAGLTVAVNVADCPELAGLSEEANAVVVEVLITSVRTLVVEVAKPAFPEYTAVMLSDPLGRIVVVNVATPEELADRVPSSAAPLRKFTVPNDDPVGMGLMVAVKVTDCPGSAGFNDDAQSAVVVRIRSNTGAGKIDHLGPCVIDNWDRAMHQPRSGGSEVHARVATIARGESGAGQAWRDRSPFRRNQQ